MLEDRLLRNKEAAHFLGMKRSKFFAMKKAGELPKETCVSGKIKGWRVKTLTAFLEERERAS